MSIESNKVSASTSIGEVVGKPVGGFMDLKEKFASTKQVAHAWQIAGVTNIRDKKIKLEGSYLHFGKTFIESLRGFSKINSAFTEEEIEQLSSSLENRKPLTKDDMNKALKEGLEKLFFLVLSPIQDVDLLFEDFQKGKPISVSSGFIGHRVIISFDGDYLQISNKGGATRRPIELYKINREKVTKTTIKEIIDLWAAPEKAYNTWIMSIFRKFDAVKDPLSLFVEQAYPLSAYQEVGNCAWENLQTSVYGTLLLNRIRDGFITMTSNKKTELIETTNKIFQHWRQFLQIQSLERYFRANSTPENPLPSLLKGRVKKIEDASISFKGVDQDLLRNIFKQYWKTKLPSDDFKHKMDKLESQYFDTLEGASLKRLQIEKLYCKKVGEISYIVKDLTIALTPAVLSTVILALSATYREENILSIMNEVPGLWMSAYGGSALRTIQLVRRYFAI